MAELDPERILALAYVPAKKRPALEALWRLDTAFASVLATGREPMVTRIRIAWWREALERLDGAPPPAEPLLEMLAAHVLTAGVSGIELATMADGWEAIAGALAPDAEALDLHATARGTTLFSLSARLLDADVDMGTAGEIWALTDLARHSSDPREAAAAIAAAEKRPESVMGRWPPALRPIGMLVILARRDLLSGGEERQGAPLRIMRMMWHRLIGR